MIHTPSPDGSFPSTGDPQDEGDFICHMVLRVLQAMKEHREDERVYGPTGLFVPDDVKDYVVNKRGVA